MKNWIISNRLYFFGAMIGAVAGYVYWKYAGCATGTCAITSNPVRSIIYFALPGVLVCSLFKEPKKEKVINND